VHARRLGSDRPVIAVDLRNHGASPHLPAHGYEEMAADLARLLAAEGPADVIGHSMGGKAAMLLALTRPELVRALVVADIAPVAYGHTQAPLVAAMQALDLSAIRSRGEADAALAGAVPDPALRAFLLQSLDLSQGAARWRLNLPALAREMPRILSFPEVASRFEGPALFLSGGLSPYVLPGHRPLIRRLFPAARFQVMPGAGHWIHAEQPREFEAAVRGFLNPA
jgi:pimeloyl-ACP methyl ester carboxylesterase